MRRWIAVSLVLAFLVVLVGFSSQHRPTTALAAYHGSSSLKQVAASVSRKHWCSRTFRVAEVVRKIRHTYRGTRNVTHRERNQIAGQEHCLRNPIRTGYVLRVNRNAKRAWAARRNPWYYATASDYDDAGATASGYHSYYGVATCGGSICFSFGTRIEFSYGGRHVVAVVDDHGPYIAGRDWDLNQNTAAALGFSGVDTVGWRVAK